MKRILLIFFLLIINCVSNNSHKLSCESNGKIDFMYINIPCEECVSIIDNFFGNEENIFSYDMIRNKESHIIINYCYNYRKTSPSKIEKRLTDNNFAINQALTEAQKSKLIELCCIIK